MFSIKFFAVLDDEISPEDDDADPYAHEQVEQNDDLDDIQGIWWLHVLFVKHLRDEYFLKHLRDVISRTCQIAA